MNLQKLVSSIVEAIIEVDYSENREDVSIPHETYEDTLALAVINSILIKYNADLDVEDRKNEDRNKDSNQRSSEKKAEKQSYNRVRQNPVGSSCLDVNHNSKDNIETTKNINDITSPSDTSSSISDLSSDTSSSFTDTSSETSLSSDTSLASTTTPSSGALTTNKFFDPFVELYLTKSHPEIWENNWTLKVHDEAKQHNKISLTSWRKRLNVRKSLQAQFENLTDDVKTTLEQRNCKVLQNTNALCSERKENGLTEQKFYNSVWFWTSQTLICQDGEYFVKIGDDIGESSTDDDNLSKCVDDNSLIPVMQAVKLFESLQKNYNSI